MRGYAVGFASSACLASASLYIACRARLTYGERHTRYVSQIEFLDIVFSSLSRVLGGVLWRAAVSSTVLLGLGVTGGVDAAFSNLSTRGLQTAVSSLLHAGFSFKAYFLGLIFMVIVSSPVIGVSLSWVRSSSAHASRWDLVVLNARILALSIVAGGVYFGLTALAPWLVSATGWTAGIGFVSVLLLGLMSYVMTVVVVSEG